MFINYIVATWAGKRKDQAEYSKFLESTLDIHMVHLYEHGYKDIDRVTIVCPRIPKKHYDTYYRFDKWKKMFGNKLVILKYQGANKHYSYDQWIQGMKNCPQADYHILIEDDYILSCPDVIPKLVDEYKRLFPNNIGYMCSFYRNDDSKLPCSMFNHAAITNGIISNDTIKNMKRPLKKFYKIKSTHQIAFTGLFLHRNIPVKDFRRLCGIPFYSSFSCKLQNYSLNDREYNYPFIAPLQLYSNDYLEKALMLEY